MTAARRALAMLLCAPAFGFLIPDHRDITERALRQAGGGRFLPTAIMEIQNANECVDEGVLTWTGMAVSLMSGDLLSLGDSSTGRGDFQQPCLPSGGLCIDCQRASNDHFDDEDFANGSLRLKQLRNAFIATASHGYYIEARKILGYALHTIQDFYAHSNWVDLDNKRPFSDLPNLDAYHPVRYTTTQPELSLRNSKDTVCSDGHTLVGRAKAGGDLLTSGYFFKDDFVKNGAPQGKCSHGLARAGISKDNDVSVMHDNNYTVLHGVAVTLALTHSISFIQDCLSQMPAGGGQLGIYGMFRVDGDKMNKLMEVKAGEVYQFEVDPYKRHHRVTWGYGGLLGELSRSVPMISGPEGMPGVSRATYLWYVTPPMPEANVGALIGLVYDPQCPVDGKTLAGDACPPMGKHLIGSGGRVEIDATGTLYLLVNDANLGNNEGDFEVSFIKLRQGSQ